jgi:sulfite reductase (NADPH) hemoprotein beta-component
MRGVPRSSEVVGAVLATYLEMRIDVGSRAERFIETVRRAGLDPFKAAADRFRTDAKAAA